MVTMYSEHSSTEQATKTFRGQLNRRGNAPAIEYYAQAMLIRSVEQRLLELFAQGKLFGTVHTCIGQEWSAVAVAAALQPGDLLFSNHRGHGHYLAWTDDVEGLIAEIMGRQNGICGGRGGSQHLCSKGFFSNGIQGGIAPVAAGLGFAQKLKGAAYITAVFIGDGTLGEGVLYETLNIAAKWELPLLVVLENNGYAQSTAQNQTLAGDINARAEAFGIKMFHSSTWQPQELLATAADCAAYVRSRSQPVFLRIDTYRLMAHSKGDDDRSREEVQSYYDKDPITLYIRDSDPEVIRQMTMQHTARVDRAIEVATSAPYAGPAMTDDQVPECSWPAWTPTRWKKPERVVNLLHEALRRNMSRDERIILLGEDVEAPYGGAFKVTKSLSQEFPGRVRNTPISEAALVGIGNGLAVQGWLPVCEIMFGDFLALALDQLLNHASKFHYMYNGQVRVPIIVRTPMGGKRGYGPTHSQSIEKHFMGLPGTTMLALNGRYDPGRLYDELFRTIDRPTIVIENKVLYGIRLTDEVPAGFLLEHSDERFPTTRLRPQGAPDATILCYGGMLSEVERAVETVFDKHDYICEVVCPIQLYPLNPWPIVESVQKSGRLVIVEEGLNFAGFGAEVVAQIAASAPGVISHVRRVAPPRHPIPSCGPLEKTLLPGEEHVVEAVVDLMHNG
jgi:2-oxoisovalerate dehydrogenase E1 component